MNIPNSDLGGEWTALIGPTATSAEEIGSWLGRAVWGPIRLEGNEKLHLVGTGLTNGAVMHGVLIGRSDSDADAPFVSPNPSLTSLSVAALVAGVITGSTIIVGPAGDQIRIGVDDSPLTNFTTISFDSGEDLLGYLYAGQKILTLQPPRDAGDFLATLQIVAGAAHPDDEVVATAARIRVASATPGTEQGRIETQGRVTFGGTVQGPNGPPSLQTRNGNNAPTQALQNTISFDWSGGNILFYVDNVHVKTL